MTDDLIARLEARIEELEAEIERLKRDREFWIASANANEEDALRKAVLRMGWPEINAYCDEINKGQDIREDGGGFFMRAIGRLFGLKPERDVVTTFQDAATAAIDTLVIKGTDDE